MAFHSIAYGDGDLCLLTVDGNDLLAYDAQTESPRWKVSFSQPLVGVLFVDPSAFPRQGGGNPFRSQSSATSAALVVDLESRLHLIDTTLGQSMGEIDPPSGPSKPYAIATSSSGAVALAIEDKLHLWRSGERIEMPGIRVRALSFSHDGRTLAVGTDKGELRMYFVAPDTKAALEETFKTKIAGMIGSISDIHQHPNGDWVVAGSNGVTTVNAAGGASRLEKIPENILRIRFDEAGKRLAVQRTDRGVVVYDWPGLSVQLRVEYTERPVRGLSFGSENWLGVALDHGDGNKIDVVTSAVHRTDTHPGRQHRSWTLMVEGKKDILSAKEAEDIRRMKSAFEPEAKKPGGFSGAGGRIGIGAMISIALIAVRVCVRASSPSPSYSSFNFPTSMPAYPKSCDKACALERVRSLKVECAALTPSCEKEAKEAEDALNLGKCAEAKSALERIAASARPDPDGTSKSPLFNATRLLASIGVNEACSSGLLRPSTTPATNKKMQLVHLKGTNADKLTTTTERIWDQTPTQSETGEAIYAAPDGTVFVAAKTSLDKIVVHRRKKSAATDTALPAEWETSYTKQGSSPHLSLFGRSGSDVWLSDQTSVAHFDGQKWTEVSTPVATVRAITGTATDTFMFGGGFSTSGSTSNDLYKRKGTTWVKEPAGTFQLDKVFGGGNGNGLFAIADEPETSGDVLLQRAGGTWAVRKPAVTSSSSGDASSTDEDSSADERRLKLGWVSPNGDAFVPTADDVVLKVSANGNVQRTTTESAVTLIWGRSSSDVYASSYGSLHHYDGKKWSTVDYAGVMPEAISGNSSELLLLVQSDY